MGIDTVGRSLGNNTYKTCFRKEEKIVHEHISFLNKYNITLEANDELLPSLYWLPKLHKDLYKFRFIAASSHCTQNISPHKLPGEDSTVIYEQM